MSSATYEFMGMSKYKVSPEFTDAMRKLTRMDGAETRAKERVLNANRRPSSKRKKRSDPGNPSPATDSGYDNGAAGAEAAEAP